MILIDGSVLEGGGQIVRMAIAFSVLTKKSIKITKIRAARPKGGLALQHLKGIQLVKEICSANVTGLSLGSTEVEFHPGYCLRGAEYTAEAGAGSVALLLQVALPAAFFCDRPVVLKLTGGTNCEMAPQIDFTTEIFRPNLEKFGVTFDFDLIRRGYFPKGGGSCKITVKPVHHLEPINLVDAGEPKKYFGWSFVSGTLPIKMADEMVHGAKDSLKPVSRNKSVEIEAYKELPTMGRDNCSGIIMGCETTTNCVLGGSALGSRRETSYETGRRAANDLGQSLEGGSCVDHYVQDQIIISMALAKGVSRVRTDFPLTLHTQTGIYIAELLTDAKFKVTQEGSSCIIECVGIGLENESI